MSTWLVLLLAALAATGTLTLAAAAIAYIVGRESSERRPGYVRIAPARAGSPTPKFRDLVDGATRDPSVPPGHVEIRDSSGKLLARRRFDDTLGGDAA